MTDSLFASGSEFATTSAETTVKHAAVDSNARTGGRLNAEQGMRLVKRLIEDADFRARYEINAAAAMAEAGIASEQIAALDPKCQGAVKLASVAELKETYDRLAGNTVAETLSMLIPNVRFMGPKSR
jgi:putative modified peptide